MFFLTSLDTPRLTLRPNRDGDAEQLYTNYCGDPACCTFLQRQLHADAIQTANMLAKWSDAAHVTSDKGYAWVICERSIDEPVGLFVVIPDGHKVEIHYGIAQRLWGQGLMAEAAGAAVAFLRDVPGIERIWTVCDVDNHGSRRVLEKIGLRQEGLLRKWLKLPAYSYAARDCWVFGWVSEGQRG
jgi:ribosomal-protein-alanine N-acetyltransferase